MRAHHGASLLASRVIKDIKLHPEARIQDGFLVLRQFRFRDTKSGKPLTFLRSGIPSLKSGSLAQRNPRLREGLPGRKQLVGNRVIRLPIRIQETICMDITFLWPDNSCHGRRTRKLFLIFGFCDNFLRRGGIRVRFRLGFFLSNLRRCRVRTAFFLFLVRFLLRFLRGRLRCFCDFRQVLFLRCLRIFLACLLRRYLR